MEAVNDDDGIREALLGYAAHGIAEVSIRWWLYSLSICSPIRLMWRTSCCLSKDRMQGIDRNYNHTS